MFLGQTLLSADQSRVSRLSLVACWPWWWRCCLLAGGVQEAKQQDASSSPRTHGRSTTRCMGAFSLAVCCVSMVRRRRLTAGVVLLGVQPSLVAVQTPAGAAKQVSPVGCSRGTCCRRDGSRCGVCCWCWCRMQQGRARAVSNVPRVDKCAAAGWWCSEPGWHSNCRATG